MVDFSFEKFLNDFFAIFIGENFYQNQTYLEYIKKPQTNDEDNIVDTKIILPLLTEVLGFDSGDIIKNQTGTGKNNSRPDFQVKLSHVNTRCFLVEDKNTAYDLSRSEPLQQLISYAPSRGYTLGLICNGKLLLGWDLTNPNSPHPILHLDLKEVVETYCGQNIFANNQTGIVALTDNQLASLKGLFRQFHLQNFDGINNLIKNISQPESIWKKNAFSSAKNSDFDELLINDLKKSINLLEDDVLYQLNLLLKEYDEFCQAQYLSNGNGNSLLEEKMSVPKIIIKLRKEILNYFRASGAGLLELEDYSDAEERLINFAEHPRGSIQELGDKFLRRLQIAQAKKQLSKKNNDDISYQQLDLIAPLPLAKQQELGIKVNKSTKVTKLDPKLWQKLHEYNQLVLDWKGWEVRQQITYEQAIKTNQFFTTWKTLMTKTVLQNVDEDKLKREFARQTAYVYVIRLLMVRICEDKNLINRKFSNGGIKNWLENVVPQYLDLAEGNAMDYLLEMSYRSAQNIYTHFFNQADLFNWYRLSQNTLIRVLNILNQFNLAQIDSDIIGMVYGRYVTEGKHEQGRYFTPRLVAEYILDGIGYTSDRPEIRDQKLLDLAAGSGSFLVHAAKRLIDSYRSPQTGKIPIDYIPSIIEQVKNNLFGLDINPFACYLAETNLLIQVIDLLKQAKDADRLLECTIDRFHIYNTDSLLLPKAENIRSPLLNPILNLELSIISQIKTKTGDFVEGFDFIVGNPPYVRADEPGLDNYRREIELSQRFATLYEKWDLFVPFIELSCQLIKAEGQIGLIVSRGIQTNNYAELLRKFIAENLKISQVDFFTNIKLFADATVNNTIFFLQNIKPDTEFLVKRLLHSDDFENIEYLPSLSQKQYQDQVFRQFVTTEIFDNVIDLEEICYCTKAMVLHSEKGLFKKDDLLSLSPTKKNIKKYVDGENIIREFAINCIRYLEWETERVPSQVSRITIPELYDIPKILFGMTSYPTFDRGVAEGDGFYVPDSVRICVKWNDVYTIKRLQSEPRQMYEFSKKQQRLLGSETGKKVKIYDYAKQQASLAKKFDLRYIVALLSSELGKKLLLENNRDENIMRAGRDDKPAKSRIYPDDLKEFPIKNISLKKQQPFIDLVEKLIVDNWQIYQLCQQGHIIKFNYNQASSTIDVNFHTILQQLNPPSWNFLNAEPQKFEIIGDRHQPISKIKIQEDQILLGKMPLLSSESQLVLKYLQNYLSKFADQGKTWQSLLKEGKIPKNDTDIQAIFTESNRLKSEIADQINYIRDNYQELNRLVNKLYNIQN